ncbi:actin organization and endocytosis protein [Polyrhizophydium stewartii]|uniref:Actin organization and endocytosis protein n=1 Tax=Polyrhizophydium stewartii TaxID=2732419 RepID=A0ABR4N7D6_9FUNG|nr:hypothetical protein HK105_006755 [Polyrhizophydium stewartii]
MLSSASHDTGERRIACLFLQGTSTLHVRAPPSLSPEVVRTAIGASWPAGIKSETVEAGQFSFELFGWPWQESKNDNGSNTCRLVLALVRTLATHGWRFLAGVGSTKCPEFADSLFFERASAVAGPVMFGMHMGDKSSLCVVGYVETDRSEAICTALRDAVVAAWSDGITGQSVDQSEFKIHLNKEPWRSKTSNDPKVRSLLSQVIHSFSTIGFRLVGTCKPRYLIDDQADGVQHAPSMDMWLFQLDDGSDSQLPSYEEAIGQAGSASAPLPSIRASASLVPRQSGREIVSITTIVPDELEIISQREVGEALVQVVRANWDNGIKSHHLTAFTLPCDDGQAHFVTKIKIPRSPWVFDAGFGVPVRSRRLLVAVLAHMRRWGWRLLASPETVRDAYTNLPFFFEPCPPTKFLEMFAVTPSAEKELLLIYNVGDMHDKSLAAAVDVINAAWQPLPVTQRMTKTQPGLVGWKMSGMSWVYIGDQPTWNRVLFINIIEGMLNIGFEFYAACRSREGHSQCDNLVFVRTAE